MFGCEDIPAVEINPNASDGDESSETDGDGETEADDDGEGGEAGDDTTVLPLYENPGRNKARAGEIGKYDASRADDELLSGPRAQGKAGDFKLYNRKVAFVIAGAGMGRAFNSTGGTVLDAVRFSGDTASPDMLLEAFPIVAVAPQFIPIDGTIRAFKMAQADKVKLIHNGSDGRAAQVRATGIDWAIPLVDQLMEHADEAPLAPINPKVKLIVDYFLDPQASYLRVVVTAQLDGDPDALNPEAVRAGLGFFVDDSLFRFYPRVDAAGLLGPDEPQIFQGYEPMWFGAFSPDLAYGVWSGEGNGLYALTLPVDPTMLLAAEDMTLADETPKEQTLVLAVGEGTANAMASAHDNFRADEAGLLPENTAVLTGRANLSAEFGGTKVEVYAVKEIVVDADGDADGETVVESTLMQTHAWLDDNVGFSLFVPPGNYKLFTRNEFGETAGPVLATVTEGETLEALTLPGPPLWATVTIGVGEPAADGVSVQPLAARVDFYRGSFNIAGGQWPTESARAVTVFTSAAETETAARLPLNGLSEVTFTWVASHGPLYTYASGTETYKAVLSSGTKQGPRGQVLTRVVDPYFTPEPQPGAENNEIAPFARYDADFNVQSDPSLSSRVAQADRLRQAYAEGLTLVAPADHDTVADYAAARQQTAAQTGGAPLWLSSVEVSPDWTHLLGIGVSAPVDRPAYYGIPFFSYLEDGTYNGILPTYGMADELIAPYQAAWIQIPHPRGESRGASFFDHFGHDPFIPYTDSLPYEAEDTLGKVQGVELVNGQVDFVYTYLALQDWFSLISQGVPLVGTASADLDGLTDRHGAQLGWARTTVYSEDGAASPGAGAFLSALAAGRTAISTGPAIDVSLYDAMPGDTLTVTPALLATPGWLPLKLRVQAPTWMPLQRVSVCINGNRIDGTTWGVSGQQNNVTRLDQIWEFPIPRADPNDITSAFVDSWLVVLAFSQASKTLDPVYLGKPIFAVTNAIRLDVDGEPGWTPRPPRQAGDPYCTGAGLCELFATYDSGRQIVLNQQYCCLPEFSGASYYATYCTGG
ncbi:MAG: hypothetical protein C4523_20760 [Myxococcales bacterium]|nr:MAG: hypothetical protein C4523_20760 [Myxococcales bacterium]